MSSTTHVFVVNERTFPLHLDYGFAGTGHPNARGFESGLAKDVARVRPGDEIVFYVNGFGFAGSWVADGQPIFESSPQDSSKFGVPLPYRVPIRPDGVVPAFLPESEALDDLPPRTGDVQWTLIYRKLKGKRGCTPILPHEADRLRRALHALGQPLTGAGVTCGTDLVPTPASRPTPSYSSSAPLLDPKGPPKDEAGLEHWVVWDLATGGPLSAQLGVTPASVEFLGNQIYAGFGMQAIDVLVCSNGEWLVLELKTGLAAPVLQHQLAKYSTHLNTRLGAAGTRPRIRWVPLTRVPKRGSERYRQAKQVIPARAQREGVRCTMVEWEVQRNEVTYR